jgi:hypothetical protein
MLFALAAGCGAQPAREPTPAVPSSESSNIPESTDDGSAEDAPTEASAPAHLCAGTAQPEPCKNDVMRQGGFQEVPACLRALPATATGNADAKAFEKALADRSNEVFECITSGGADTSQLGKVMTVRVVSMPGQPSQTSFVATDLSPAAKSCVEKAVGQAKWPTSNEGTSEVTLRLVMITRVWVDDPKGACPPR